MNSSSKEKNSIIWLMIGLPFIGNNALLMFFCIGCIREPFPAVNIQIFINYELKDKL